MKDLEKICDSQEKCKDCPLLIDRIVDYDPVYDYHERIICYKKNKKQIDNILKFLNEDEENK